MVILWKRFQTMDIFGGTKILFASEFLTALETAKESFTTFIRPFTIFVCRLLNS